VLAGSHAGSEAGLSGPKTTVKKQPSIKIFGMAKDLDEQSIPSRGNKLQAKVNI